MTGPSAGAGPRLARHFVVLVYPFLHTLDGANRAARLGWLEGRWRPWWARLDDEALRDALDDTYFFLPHVRELLFPETSRFPEDPARQLEQAREVAALPPGRLGELVPPDAALRLTYDPERLAGPGARLEVQARGPRGQVVDHCTLRVDWIDAVLFPHGVGFLTLKTELEEPEPDARRVAALLAKMRLVHPPFPQYHLSTWRRADDPDAPPFEARDLVDYLLQGLTAATDQRAFSLGAFRARFGARVTEERDSGSPFGQVYAQVFHLFTYALLVDDPSASAGAAHEAASGGDEAGAATGGNTPLFGSPAEQALYELATGTDTSNPAYLPHPDQLARLFERSLIALWQNWLGMALHDNVVFLGTRSDPFTRRGLPHNIESDYFPLYLLALFQRTRLSVLYGQIVRREVDLSRNLREARKLWDDLLMFKNHYWFGEVTRSPQGIEIYRRYRQGLDVVALCEEVSAELRELQEHYERRSARVTGDLLELLTFVGLPVGIAAQLFSNALTGQASFEFARNFSLGMVAGTGVLWWLWHRFRRR